MFLVKVFGVLSLTTSAYFLSLSKYRFLNSELVEFCVFVGIEGNVYGWTPWLRNLFLVKFIPLFNNPRLPPISNISPIPDKTAFP